jgi:hypothetical protein
MLKDLEEQMSKIGKDSDTEEEKQDNFKPIGFNRDEIQLQNIINSKAVKKPKARKLNINKPKMSIPRQSGENSSTFKYASPRKNLDYKF